MARLARRFGVVRGVMIFRLAARFELLALVYGHPGSRTAIFLEAWLRRRRSVIVLELIASGSATTRLRRGLSTIRFRLFERPALARGMRVGQVLTEPEVAANASRFRLPVGLFRFLPWAWSREGGAMPPFDPDASGVLSSGRESCDWETMFAAARGRRWPLTVICGERDHERVTGLNEDGRAQVFCEISREEHDRLLREAAIYVLPLVRGDHSAGQVRLMSAVEEGAPVVASNVPALHGYIEPGSTAVTVEAQDPDALREAVDSLLAEPKKRERLREAAMERAGSRTYDDYFNDLRKLIDEQVNELELEARTT
jgi:glycosyltransferase involved in cell wall biosynthesis